MTTHRMFNVENPALFSVLNFRENILYFENSAVSESNCPHGDESQ